MVTVLSLYTARQENTIPGTKKERVPKDSFFYLGLNQASTFLAEERSMK